ncbi:hypothetical protein [Paenibacillus sp. SN-8-1]|uniref:hypothetical protein n=1 Tax=Paenibacillus sp. SN-8-1 TaxID=3435409 RepID=UPI003D9A717D
MTYIQRTLDREKINNVIDDIIVSGTNKLPFLDLSGVSFVEPYGMVLLLQLIDRFDIGEIHYPRSRSAATYLERAGFFDVAARYTNLPHDIKALKSQVPRNQNNQTMLTITPIEYRHDARAAVNIVNTQTRTILENELLYDADDVNDFIVILSELLGNIPRHSKSYGYVCAQVYRIPHSEVKYASVCISDKGIGIRRTFEESDYITIMMPDDEKALNVAVVKERSSKKDGGTGYKGIKEKIRKFNGTLYVRSGRAEILIDPDGDFKITPRRSSFVGTQIEFKLPQRLG